MDYNKNTTNSKKNKHLTFQKRCFIEIRFKDKWSAYKIAKVINRLINTILKEVRRGTVTQIKLGQKVSKNNWSLDACLGDSIINNRFHRSEMVCIKTVYYYGELDFMNVKNSDLPIKLRINKKKRASRLNKIKLGRSIEERDKSIDTK